jgi:hypothetical protein
MGPKASYRAGETRESIALPGTELSLLVPLSRGIHTTMSELHCQLMKVRRTGATICATRLRSVRATGQAQKQARSGWSWVRVAAIHEGRGSNAGAHATG